MKVDGIKRHITIDTTGLLAAANVTAANVQDRAAFPALLRKTMQAGSNTWTRSGSTGLHQLNGRRGREQGRR